MATAIGTATSQKNSLARKVWKRCPHCGQLLALDATVALQLGHVLTKGR